MSIPEN